MDNFITFIVILFIFGGVIKNILQKLSEAKSQQGDDEEPSMTRQLRDLLQNVGEEEEPGSQPETPQRPPRPAVRPIAQPVGRTQPPRPAARPMAHPAGQAQPTRPMQLPRQMQRPKPSQAPAPVRPPAPQPVARQQRTSPEPAATWARPIQKRPAIPAARAQTTAPIHRQDATRSAEQVIAPKATPQKAEKRVLHKQVRKQNRHITIRLNRKNLGTAMVITEIMNPPLALRGRNMPWDT